MIRRLTLLLTPVLALLFGSSAAAQVGVLDQPYRNDPFQPLLDGRWSVTHHLSVGADNNTLGVGDIVAIGYLADDFRPSDIFLVAGLVPVDEGGRVGTQNRTGITVGFPVGRYVTLGVVAGGRVLGTGQVPDNVTALIRDGVTGDEITVDLTELGGEVFGYAEGGLSGVVDYPLLRTPFGELQLMGGAGVRYVRSVSHLRVGFSGDSGEETSTVTLTRSGVSTTLNMAAPLGEDIMADGGSGVAMDIMAGVAVGPTAQLRLAVTDLGSADVMVDRRQVTTITMDEVSFVDLSSTADSVSVTDTVAGLTRSVPLPTTFRADATYRPLKLIGFGARLAVPLKEDALSLEPLVQAGVELRPLAMLPLRAGVTAGDFGAGFFAGFGLDTRTVGFDLEVASSGGPTLADVRGVAFRSALSLTF